MHWLDSLPGKLPREIRDALRGLPDLQTAWERMQNGTWMLLLAQAATQDPLTIRDYQQLATELATEVATTLQSREGSDPTDAVALAEDCMARELADAGGGDPADTAAHRSRAHPVEKYDTTLRDLRRAAAEKVRARFPAPP